ncbi:MAG: hypothetical protein LBP53_03985, partial [Candidatus Peribacteria bacterium]|nr:hypothetical protein [Candidatus Peribacteria bacterium]
MEVPILRENEKVLNHIAQWVGIYVFNIIQKNPSYRDTENDLLGWSNIRNILKELTRIPDY